MNELDHWAQRWGVSPQALAELPAILTPTQLVDVPNCAQNEDYVKQSAQLNYARAGAILWRNNVGAAYDRNDRLIRYGLANETKAMNAKTKSGDLIGITPITCACGYRYGVFTSVEAKSPLWSPRPNDLHERAQRNWQKIVTSYGGISLITNDPGVHPHVKT